MNLFCRNLGKAIEIWINWTENKKDSLGTNPICDVRMWVTIYSLNKLCLNNIYACTEYFLRICGHINIILSN